MGAWIEIVLPVQKGLVRRVAPLVGAWIEISKDFVQNYVYDRRSPCGSVD